MYFRCGLRLTYDTRSDMNSPMNVMYMTPTEQIAFAHTLFYIDKEALDHFRAELLLLSSWLIQSSYGKRDYYLRIPDIDVNIEFRTRYKTSVEPPNPDSIRVHASFATPVCCGADSYLACCKKVNEKRICTWMGKRIVSCLHCWS